MKSPIDKLLASFRQPAPRTNPQEPEDAGASLARACRAIAPQGLFVIGAARTGTTILQNALNDARGIFLFGEPDFHTDPGTADFASRYNARHRAWGNQENKSSYCPAFFEQDAPWHAYLQHLGGLYRRVGSKIVINPAGAGEHGARLFDFHCRHFYASHYVFTFRNPLDTLMSTRGLAALNGDAAAGHATVLAGFLEVVLLYIRMLRNLPEVSVLFHETVDAAALGALGARLGMPLPGAHAYYDRGKVRRYGLDELPAEHRPAAEAALGFYEDFRREASAGFALPQIEQNAGHLDPRHYTPLGELARRARRLLDELRAAGG